MNSIHRPVFGSPLGFRRSRPHRVGLAMVFLCLSGGSSRALSISTPVPLWQTAQQRAWNSYGGSVLRTSTVLADGSLLVVVAGVPQVTMTRIDAFGTVLSQARVGIPVMASVAGVAMSAEGEVYVAGALGNQGSVVSKWDAYTGQALWNALPVDEIGSPEALAIDASGDVDLAGVSRWGSGMVFTRLHRFTGALVTAPVLLPMDYQNFLGMALDPDGNAILVGGSTYGNAPTVVGKISSATGLEIWGPVTISTSGYGPTLESVRCTASGDVVVATRAYGELTVSRLSGGSGALAWTSSFSTTNQVGATALDGAGDVYATVPWGSGDAAMVTRLDGATGSAVWSVTVPSTVFLSGLQLTVDGEGDPTVTPWASWSAITQAFRLAHANGATKWGPVTLSTPLQVLSMRTVPSGDAVALGLSNDGLSTMAMDLAAASGAVVWGPLIVDGPAPSLGSWTIAQVDASGDVVFSGNGDQYTLVAPVITKVDGRSGARAWGPIALPFLSSYLNNTPLVILTAPGGDVFVANPSDVGGTPTLRMLSGTDGSGVWGPLTFSGGCVAMELDVAGGLIVLRRESDVQNHYQFVVEKRSAATGALVWGPFAWHSPAQQDDIPTGLGIDGLGNVVVVGTSKIAQNGGVRGIVLCYSGTSGGLLWGPIALDDFGQGVGSVLVERGVGNSVFVTTTFRSGSWSGYPVVVRRLDTTTGGATWGPISPLLPTPSGYPSPLWRQAVDPSGDLLVGLTSYSTPTVAKLRATDGSVAWSASFGAANSPLSSLGVGPDGNVAVITNGAVLSRLSGVDGSPLWSDLTTATAGVSNPGALAMRGLDVIIAGSDRSAPAAARISGSFAIVPPADGALAAACGQPFTLNLAAANGRTPYVWGVVSGALPPGLILSTGGQISGAASAEGAFAFRVQVQDVDAKTAVRDLVLEVVDGNPLVPILAAPGALCQGSSAVLSVAGSYSSYLWQPGGQTTPTITVSPLQPTTYGVILTNPFGCQSHGAITIQPRPATPAPVVSAPSSAAPGATGLLASVPLHAGSAYAWSITGGSITTGQGTSQITFSAGIAGTLTIQVVETPAGGCASPAGSASVTVSGSSATGFFTMAPCRVLDTRNPVGPWGGPTLSPGTTRTFTVAGTCGIPSDAKSVAGNLTVVVPAAAGDLFVWAGNTPMPLPAATPLVPGKTRAVMAMLGLAPDGTGTMSFSDQSAGPLDVILDVSGYFR